MLNNLCKNCYGLSLDTPNHIKINHIYKNIFICTPYPYRNKHNKIY